MSNPKAETDALDDSKDGWYDKKRRMSIWLLGLGIWALSCATPFAFAGPCDAEWQGTAYGGESPEERLKDADVYALEFFVET